MGCARPRQIFHPFYYKAQLRPPSHHVVIAFIFPRMPREKAIPSQLSRRRVVALGHHNSPQAEKSACQGSAMRSVKKPGGSACLIRMEIHRSRPPTTYVTSMPGKKGAPIQPSSAARVKASRPLFQR